MIKFFLDANIPYCALEVFRELKLYAVHARDVGLGRADDYEIVRHAVENKSILVTKDMEFANLLLFPTGSHQGLVVLRLPYFFKAHQFANA